MGRPKRQFVFTYSDLARASGLTENAIAQHVVRGHLDCESLESVMLFLARYGRHEFKTAILSAALDRSIPDDPGGWKSGSRRGN